MEYRLAKQCAKMSPEEFKANLPKYESMIEFNSRAVIYHRSFAAGQDPHDPTRQKGLELDEEIRKARFLALNSLTQHPFVLILPDGSAIPAIEAKSITDMIPMLDPLLPKVAKALRKPVKSANKRIREILASSKSNNAKDDEIRWCLRQRMETIAWTCYYNDCSLAVRAVGKEDAIRVTVIQARVIDKPARILQQFPSTRGLPINIVPYHDAVIRNMTHLITGSNHLVSRVTVACDPFEL